MAMQLGYCNVYDFAEVIRRERHAFAAKVRVTRAVLGWNQGEFGSRVGLTQRAIHKIEQGDTEPRRATIRAIEEVWHHEGIEFEDLPDGGFRVSLRPLLLDRPRTSSRLHTGPKRAGVGAGRLSTYRA